MHPRPTRPDPAEDPTPYYREILHDLIELGTEIARHTHRQALAAEGAEAGDHTLAFDRVARTIRRTILLAQRIEDEAPVRKQSAARRRIIRAVEDAIERTPKSTDKPILHNELQERLEAPEFADDITATPIAEIIADLCRDLGIAALPGTKPWMRRTPADIQLLHRRATPPQPHRHTQAKSPRRHSG